MADTSVRLAGPAHMAASATTVYTVPALTTAQITNIHVCNGTAGSVNFTISIGTDAASTRIYDEFVVPAQGVADWSGMMVLAAGEIIQAFAGSATSLTLTISGVETT